jgi:hypothetical protein
MEIVRNYEELRDQLNRLAPDRGWVFLLYDEASVEIAQSVRPVSQRTGGDLVFFSPEKTTPDMDHFFWNEYSELPEQEKWRLHSPLDRNSCERIASVLGLKGQIPSGGWIRLVDGIAEEIVERPLSARTPDELLNFLELILGEGSGEPLTAEANVSSPPFRVYLEGVQQVLSDVSPGRIKSSWIEEFVDSYPAITKLRN